MHIVQLKALSNGAHPDLCSENITTPPEGWAVIPEGFLLPVSFPFVDIQAQELPYTRTVEDIAEDGEPVTVQQVYTLLTVTAMEEGVVPESVPQKEIPTQLDQIEAQLVYTAMMTDTLLEV